MSEEAEARRGFITMIAILGTVLLVTSVTQFAAFVAPRLLAYASATYGSIWPQGWGFFANTGDADTLSVYRLDGDTALGPSELPLFMSSENDWGLGRVAASRQNQAYTLAAQLPVGAWSTCATPITGTCLAHLRQAHTASRFQAPLLCGGLVFVESRPWSPPDARSTGDSGPSSVAEVVVSCAS